MPVVHPLKIIFPVADARGRPRGTRSRVLVLAVVASLAATVSTGVATPATAAPGGHDAGTATAAASVTNLAEAANSPGATTVPAPDARLAEFARRAQPNLPSRPSVGSRPAPATGAGAAGPAAGSAPAVPAVAPPLASTFDGITQTVGCGGCQPSDSNAATSGLEIVELVNTFIQVTTNTGSVLCGGGVTLNRLLRSTDSLTDPRIQFDNINRRFSFAVTIVPASTSATPAMWVAASDTADACGTWRIYRLTFNGGSFPAGTFLDFPMLGQDTNALLISTRNFTPSGENFTVYGLPKSTIYAGTAVSFSAFTVASLTAPITNAGQPMVTSAFSYFLAAVPGTGYRLYRLTNSGGPGAALTLQASISSPFTAPTRRANQPGTTTTLDPSDGNILSTPFFDGNGIWFAHDVDLAGFPTIRYGVIFVLTNAITAAIAYHSGTSDDFVPSIGLGLNSGTVYLNWTYTDAPSGTAASNVVDSLPGTQALGNLIGTSVAYSVGSSTSQTRFGDFSSVSIDPLVAGGTCAVLAGQYFAPDGTWRTRLARVGSC